MGRKIGLKRYTMESTLWLGVGVQTSDFHGRLNLDRCATFLPSYLMSWKNSEFLCQLANQSQKI